MDHEDGEIRIPEDLDQVVRRGIAAGRAAVARRRMRRRAVRSLCSLALVTGLVAGGIRLSPAFAAAVGELVRAFGVNQTLVQGGAATSGGAAALTMERSGDAEYIRLTFRGADAGRYQARFASWPKTITITLPGTEGVEVLSEISRARDTSQYIKGVWTPPPAEADTAAIQLELESDADVQIREYRDPGSLVIQLTPTRPRMDTVYSLRTLSVDAAAAGELAEAAPDSARLLRDEAGGVFLEYGQYADQAEAEQAGLRLSGETLVEERTGNNVPAAFATMADYESSCLLEAYYRLLLRATEAGPVLDFLDEHFSSASSEERDTMLRGLSGFLQEEEEPETVDWARAAAFYRMDGLEPPDWFDHTNNGFN